MSTANQLTKTFVSASITFGMTVGVGILAAPAQAGTLGWDDGTSDFFQQVNPVSNNTFSVAFSPTSLGGVAAIFQATGEFAPPFPLIPPNAPVFRSILPADSAVGNFRYVSGSSASTFIYELTNDLVFQFDADNNGIFNAAQDVSVKYGIGSQFRGNFDTNSSGGIEGVGFELDTDIGSLVTIQGKTFTPTGIELGFEDLPGGVGGEYNALAAVSTPEPTSMLGFFAVGAVGAVATFRKRKIQLPMCARHQ